MINLNKFTAFTGPKYLWSCLKTVYGGIRTRKDLNVLDIGLMKSDFRGNLRVIIVNAMSSRKPSVAARYQIGVSNFSGVSNASWVSCVFAVTVLGIVVR